jgi:hypothetical protein
VLGVSSLVACSASSPEASLVAEADFPGVFESVVCAMFDACCPGGGARAGCYTWHDAPARLDEYQTYHADRAAQCIAVMRERALTCTIRWANAQALDQVCPAVYAGSQPSGAPCNRDSDCAGSYDKLAECAISAPTFVGICNSVKYATADDDCRALWPSSGQNSIFYPHPCPPGTFCATSGACKPLLRVGQPCDAATKCGDALWCSPGGICTDAKADGEACTSSVECQSVLCDGGRCVAGDPVGCL